MKTKILDSVLIATVAVEVTMMLIAFYAAFQVITN